MALITVDAFGLIWAHLVENISAVSTNFVFSTVQFLMPVIVTILAFHWVRVVRINCDIFKADLYIVWKFWFPESNYEQASVDSSFCCTYFVGGVVSFLQYPRYIRYSCGAKGCDDVFIR